MPATDRLDPPVRALPVGVQPRWLRVTAPLLVFVVALVTAWYRLPADSRNTFWAEDARIFSFRALEPGQLPWSVFTSYDGYVHALPQSIAFVLWYALPIPVDLMALAFTLAACAAAAAVAAAIYLLTGAWGLNLPGRLLLAFTTVLVPGLTYEVLGNLANLHWFLLWLAPFLFLARPTRWWSAVLLGIAGFVVLASEVQALLFAPLLLWRITDRRRWPLLIGAVAAAVIQAIAVLGGGRQTWGEGRPRILSIIDGYALQVPLVGLSGTKEAASTIVISSGWIAAFAALVPFGLCAVWWAWGSRRRILLAALMFAASVIIWTVGYALNLYSILDFTIADLPALLEDFPLLRYAIVPLMLLFAFVGLAVGRQDLTRPSFERIVAGVVAGLCVVVFAVGYSPNVPTLRAAGPTWTTGLEAARASCEGVPGSQDVVIPIAPAEYWTFTVTCGRIER